MNNKTLILIGLCICLLFTLPMVSAAEISADSGLIDNSVIESNFDNVDSDIASSIEDDAFIDSVVADDGDISQIPAKGEKLSQSNPDNDILSADGSGNSFTDLKILIDKAISSGNPLTLDRNFAFVEGDDDAFKKGIVISSPVTIIGDNHIIDANYLARIFVISSDNVLLDGITFKNGKTTESSDFGSDGGALYIQGNHATLENCNFINNTAYENGGAIYITGDGCTLTHTVFRDNIAHDDGGAIAWYGQNGIISDLIASGNTADGENGNPSGGTLLITGNDISMDMLNISNSRLYKDGGDKPLRGGAIFLTGNNCNITNSVFTNCSVDSTVENSSGGAIYVLGNNTNILNCNFTNNSAIEDGGALYIDGENCTLNHTVFIGNVAHNDGGAIEWNGDNGVIYDLTASGNYADCGNGGSKGGTLLISGNNMHLDKLNVSNTYVNGEHYTGTSAVQGGALALSGNYCNITNSVFTNCSVVYYKDDSNASGGALYIWGNHTNIVNCNFTNNTASEDGGAIYIEGKDCTLNNTVFIGNVAHNDGGAIEWNGDNGRVYNLTAIGNYADSDEGYYYGNPSEGSSKGGTLVLSGNNMNLEKLNITNSRVFANHYTGDKPLQGGAVFLTGNNCNISDSIFHNCSVKYDKEKSNGGAMYIVGNNARLINCNFTKNTATKGAGAIYIQGDYTFMDNCNVLNNSANDAGGIWISGKENNITNSNISYNNATGRNNAGNGGGIYYQGNNNTVSYSNIDHNIGYNGANVYMVANMAGGKLIGCNITNGRASNFGGGVEWLQGSKECLIKDCYFYNDTSANHGGGVHWYPGTNGQIDNCTFESCHVDAQKNGGAIYAGATGSTAASGTIISNSKFINCTSGSRGVLTWIGNNGLIVNNTFINCGKSSGSTNYGGVQAIQIQQGKNNQIIGCNFTNCTGTLGGGAIRLQGDDKNLVDNITIADCHFDNCTAQQSAGAIYMTSLARNVKLENNTFTNNHAPNYGALFVDDGATMSSFVNNNFTNNSATASDGNGGAARLHANINVVNSTFTANSCNGSGGAIYTTGVINVLGSTFENNTAKSGGAIATQNSNLVVDQSTFKYNKAESGSAISTATITMSNTELLENQASFDKWENKNYLFTDDHLTVSGTFVGKDNLLNGIKANSGTFNNVTYCGVNGGGVGEGTTNTDDVLSANSYNEVHQIIVMEVYDVNDELKYNVSTYTDEDGNYNFDLSLDGAVVSLVKVYHPEDNYYTGAEYEIVRVPSILNIICENIYVEEVENITFKVTGSKDIPTGNITVLINDTEGNVIFNGTIPLNGSGEANITLSGLNASQYYIYASYNGDNDYLPVNETADFNVSKWNSTVEVVPIPTIIYGSLEDINITVSSDATTGNFTGNLTINITSEDAIGFENISQIIITIGDDGKVIDWTINDMILPVGNYTIAVAYSGNYKYNGNSSKAKFTVNKDDSAVTVNLTNITYGDNETIKYNVTDGATGNVTITITGDALDEPIVLPEVPIVNGTVGVVVADLLGGNYTVNITYNGDNNFNPSSAVANFSVGKATPTVNVNTTDIDYNTTEDIKVNVTGVEGGEVPTGNVTVIVRNASGIVVTFNEVPIENGVVTVPVDNLPAGDYEVDVTYNGDDNYAESTFTGGFTVNPIDSSVTVDPVNITYGEDEIIKYNVTDGATGNVTITITGDALNEPIVLPEVPIVNGTVGVVVADLLGGNYTVNVTYNGDNNFNPSSAVANFSVGKATPSVNVNTTDIDYNTSEPVKVNVTGVEGGEVPTGNVTVIVRNASGVVVTFNEVPIENGVVTVPVENLPAGDYEVDVTYNGDDNYDEASFTGSFSVGMIDSSVTVDPVNITYGEDEVIKYNVTDGATGNVTITITGDALDEPIVLPEVPIVNGTVGVVVSDLLGGNYTVNITYNGDNNFNPSSAVANFSVGKATPSVNVNTTDIDYNTTEDIKVNVTGVDGGAVPTGNVTVIVRNSSGGAVFNYTVPIENGVVTVPVEDLPAGDYYVNVTYNGDENYAEASFTGGFTVNKINPTVEVNTSDIVYGDTENINITLPEDATGTVNVTVKGPDGFEKTFTDLPVEDDGTVTVPVEDLNAGDYTVDVSYSGDNNYNPQKGTGSFNVDKSTPTVSVEGTDIDYGESDTITVNVTGKNITGNVTIFIGGQEYDTVDLTQTEDGATAVLNIPGLSGGKHTVKAVYNGDDNHYSNQSENQFEVSKVEPSIDVKPTDIDYGQDEDISITLTGVEGGSAPTGNVTVIVRNSSGDVVFNDTVNLSDGKITVSVEDLPSGDYNVTVSYNGDKNYTSIEDKKQFSVGKFAPAVSVNTTDIDYHDSESIKVNVTGVDGGSTPTGNVTVVVFNETGGVVYNQTHNLTNGAVTVPVDGLVAGKYNVTVSYNGDDNYRHADGNANFTVNKIDPSILVNASDIDYHDSETINVTVNDDATGTVSITVKNETGDVVYSNSSELSGSKASFTVPDLSAGKYNVTVEYSGDNNYNAETGKTNFIVNKIDTPVNLETENITYGEEETISVSVNDDATGSVTITIYSKDGTPVYSETVPIDKASAQITVPELNAGNYTVHVDYSGDGNYKPGSADGKFEVAKADAIVEIHVYDIIYGEIEELTVTCNAPGNVTIYVNGVNITLPLEEGYGHTLFAALLNAYSGKAQWDLENLAAGTYPARVHYNGNENYNEAEDEDVFNVLKKETSVSVSVDDIKVGEDAVINVELSPSAAPGKLTITVDGKEYTVTPKNGKASLKVPGLKAGNHTVTVSYPGSENYTDSSNETTFTVSKVKPDIDVSAPTIKVGEDGKITVTLPKDATGKVTIEIDGKNYTTQIKDGKAVFTVSGLKVGKHPIKVFYTGDDKYESSVVDGGYIKVIEDNNNGSNDHKGHANGIDLSTKATGNPVLALLFVLVFLGIIPLKRKKDEEDED